MRSERVWKPANREELQICKLKSANLKIEDRIVIRWRNLQFAILTLQFAMLFALIASATP